MSSFLYSKHFTDKALCAKAFLWQSHLHGIVHESTLVAFDKSIGWHKTIPGKQAHPVKSQIMGSPILITCSIPSSGKKKKKPNLATDNFISKNMGGAHF
jgi:hypothetical protein